MNKKKKPNRPRPIVSVWSHLRENWRLCVIVAVIIVSSAGSTHLYLAALHAQKATASWPSAEAKISKSQVSRIPAPPPNNSTITAVLDLTYKVDGTPVNSRYTRTWSTSQKKDYEDLLAEGKTISVKYSPIDPTSVSLHPIGP